MPKAGVALEEVINPNVEVQTPAPPAPPAPPAVKSQTEAKSESEAEEAKPMGLAQLMGEA